jgi:RNA polymerase sigma-70 factor (ECF subfamily)
MRRIQVQTGVNAAPLAEIADPESPDPFWEVEYRQYLVSRALQLMQYHFQPTTWKACWEVVVHGRPPADVAAELQISVNSVRAAKCRVLCHLRRELDGLLN